LRRAKPTGWWHGEKYEMTVSVGAPPDSAVVAMGICSGEVTAVRCGVEVESGQAGTAWDRQPETRVMPSRPNTARG